MISRSLLLVILLGVGGAQNATKIGGPSSLYTRPLLRGRSDPVISANAVADGDAPPSDTAGLPATGNALSASAAGLPMAGEAPRPADGGRRQIYTSSFGCASGYYDSCPTCSYYDCRTCPYGYVCAYNAIRGCASGFYDTCPSCTYYNCAPVPSCPAGTYCTTNGVTTGCFSGWYDSCPDCVNYVCRGCTAGYSCSSNVKRVCPAGTYSGAYSSSCSTCSAGTWSGTGASGCPTCSAGWYSSSGSSSCSACSAGSFSSNSGSSSCTACSVGSYASSSGSSGCTTCAAGSYCAQGASYSSPCPAGSYSNAGSASCVTCPSGTYSSAGSSRCATCPAGSACASGSSLPSVCSPGTWSAAGSSSCNTCPAMTASPEWGATGNAACVACAAGWVSDVGATVCSLRDSRHCPQGWAMPPLSNHCYQLQTPALSWSAADTSCRELVADGTLASVRNTHELAMTASQNEGRHPWVGLSRSVSSGCPTSRSCSDWTWARSGVPTQFISSAWAPGEPNNWGGNEACVNLNPLGTNDLVCSSTSSYWCEVPRQWPSTSVLGNDESVFSGQALTSASGRFSTVFEGSRGLVVYDGSSVVWMSGTAATGHRATMQRDGNVVVYTDTNVAVWETSTPVGSSRSPFRLVMQDDGNLVLYDVNNAALWATNTVASRTPSSSSSTRPSSSRSPAPSATLLVPTTSPTSSPTSSASAPSTPCSPFMPPSMAASQSASATPTSTPMPTPSATFFHAFSLASHTDEQLPPALASPQGLPSVRVATSPSVRVATSPSATVTSFARPVVAGAAVEGAPSSGNSVIAALAALLAVILVCFGAFFLRSRWRAHGGRERTYITPSARGNGPPPPVSSCSATDGRDASSIISANAGQGGSPPAQEAAATLCLLAALRIRLHKRCPLLVENPSARRVSTDHQTLL